MNAEPKAIKAVISLVTLILGLASLVGCASTSKTDSRVNSLDMPGTSSSQEISDDLRRSGESWGFYAVDVTPITPALRKARMQETSLAEGADGEAVNLRVLAAEKATSRVCFEIKIHTLGVFENEFTRWKFVFSNPGSGASQVLLLENANSYPERKSKASYQYKYSSEAIACAYGNVRLMSGLNIYAIPPEDWNPSAYPSMLTWNFK